MHRAYEGIDVRVVSIKHKGGRSWPMAERNA